MAIQLADVIRGVRDAHPSFHRTLVPDAVIARFLTGYQREVVGKALQIDPTFLAQQMSVGFTMDAANAVGTVGAGTDGGLPIDADVSAMALISQPLGTASEVDVSGSDVVTLVSESVVASATSTTLVKTGAGWTTNAYQNYTVVITQGKGAGQRRTVASNTATQLTVSQAWDTTPDTTSLFTVVDEVIESDKTFGVVASAPFSVTRVGYLVKVNASGVPYLDYATPVTARYDVGIPLPEHHAVIGGTVRLSDANATERLTLVDYQARLDPRAPFAAYVLNNELFLCGGEGDWLTATALDLRYVPVPPALTATTDYFLVPDSAYSMLVNGSAAMAAVRVNGLPDAAKVDATTLWTMKQESEQAWLRTVSAGKRNRFTVIKEWTGY